MKPSEVQAHVDHIAAVREEALTNLALRVREDLVEPACERYGLRFVSEMGCYFFAPAEAANEGETFGSTDEAAEHGYDLEDVFAALDVDVGDTLCLGHWVESYPEVPR